MENREGFDWWDRFTKLKRFSFILSYLNSVKKVEDKTGNYVEFYEASIIVDDMQSEINTLRQQLAEREWISVDDRLPDVATDVLAYREDDDWQVVCFLANDGNFYIEPEVIAHAITHWKPLDTPPK